MIRDTVLVEPNADERVAHWTASEGVYRRAYRLVARLASLFAALTIVVVLLLALAAWPFEGEPRLVLLAREAVAGGLGAVVLAALLLSLTALAGTLLLAMARQLPAFAQRGDEQQDFASPNLRGRASPGFAARVGQGVAMPGGAGLIFLGTWLLWPEGVSAAGSGNANLLAALAFALAFVALVAERMLNATAATQLPEAPNLRRLLLLTTVLLMVGGCLEVGRGAGWGWTGWVTAAALVVPVLAALELALRAVARLFLPAPANDRAAAVTESLVVGLLTRRPRAPGALIRTHLGVDFARNWAIAYLAASALPAVCVMAVLCWGLSGLKLIELDRRGVYERLGTPVAVLGPGLHLLLPWPLGRLRPLEVGTIHAIAIGSAAPPEADDQVSAEAIPPTTANRLWTTQHATEVSYLVASRSGAVESFQLVSTEILALYRTGLTDADARQAVYGTADQEMAVREAAARLATRYFGRRTLDQVMGDQPQTLAETLRRDLAADVTRAQAGIEILAVVIAEIHPPAGAAAAYQMVQAAEINARASVSDEVGRATRTVGVAQQEAHQMGDGAQATAAETRDAAAAVGYSFAADRRAAALGPDAFMLERRLGTLRTVFAHAPLTLIDHRLAAAQGATLDLRALPAQGDLAVIARAPSPPIDPDRDNAVTRGRFSYMPPGSTADTAAPTPDAPTGTPARP